jgi:hypothetical protein
MLALSKTGTISAPLTTDWFDLFSGRIGATNGTIIVETTNTSAGAFDGTLEIHFSNDWDSSKGVLIYNTANIDAASKFFCYEISTPFRYVRFKITLNTISQISYQIYGNYNTEAIL